MALIHRGNVASLKVAWTFRTGDSYQPARSRATAFEATPLFVDGTLYLATPLGRIIALDPVTGKERWAYDAKVDRDAGYGDFANRGVSTWKSPSGQRRIILATIDPTNRLLLIPSNNLAAEVRLIRRADFDRERETAGRDLTGDWEFSPQLGTPYGMARRLLRAPGGWPCTPPPWGTLNAVDADTGAVKWTVPIGQLPALGPAGPPPPHYGSIALGGPIVTAGGLVFMAGTLNPALRAFDVATGKELWKGELPTSARAMPMTFRGPDGKQYVVISAGGHGLPVTPLGDWVIAFTLG